MFGQKCYVLGLKGQAMLSFKQDKQKTFDLLNESNELCGNKTQSGTLVALMFSIINLEKAGVKTVDEVVAMFEKTMAICAVNKDNVKDGDKYKSAEQKILNVSAKYLTCEVLVPLAQKNFDTNQANLDWLRTNMKLLKKNKCYDTDEGSVVFGKVAEAYFDLEPSATGASGIATLYLSKKNYPTAIEWFNKANDMAESDEEKAEYLFSIAKAYSYNKSYGKAKLFALKAAGFKKGWGAPYVLIGDCYAQSSKTCDDGKEGVGKYGVYWVAVDKYKKAKAVDASIVSIANRKIASVSSRFPTVQDVFFLSLKNGDAYQMKCWINESTTVKLK